MQSFDVILDRSQGEFAPFEFSLRFEVVNLDPDVYVNDSDARWILHRLARLVFLEAYDELPQNESIPLRWIGSHVRYIIYCIFLSKKKKTKTNLEHPQMQTRTCTCAIMIVWHNAVM